MMTDAAAVSLPEQVARGRDTASSAADFVLLSRKGAGAALLVQSFASDFKLCSNAPHGPCDCGMVAVQVDAIGNRWTCTACFTSPTDSSRPTKASDAEPILIIAVLQEAFDGNVTQTG